MKKIAFIPSRVFYNNSLFNLENKTLNRDNVLMPFYILKNRLQEMNIDLNTIDLYSDYKKLDAVFFLNLNINEIKKCQANGLGNKLIYIMLEPPVVRAENSIEVLKKMENTFKYIMTWQDDLIDNRKYIKINYPEYFGEVNIQKVNFENKKLLTNISGYKFSTHPDELYSKRLEVIEFFEEKYSNNFDFYGFGWERALKMYKNYHGRVEDKIKTYKKYKFALSFENMRNINGYITEKIFDCFKARVVPIYWGANNIEEFIPKECFIDYRKFMDVEKLYKYISNVNKDIYNQYLRNIEKYLISDEIKQFNSESFSNKIIEVINLIER
ncbi:hypothetical protein GM661_06720 [Iocasia frigidifontis]|uniref:Fucosyltransferase C-terminal domain-containing protein n=1 Tax=Iocasia fonsfrigidae TaxID=2682810 RepID=A0A8A7K921_9FIRM|nr:glycosyltransferase family 10 [Iocasia fonsfrigidae]QTL97700.1 hypothetical protein GM661_06720 [Iocasia fonsfrigidae]